MISPILLLCQMLMITSVTINLSEQCTCDYYSQEMCNLYSLCSWNNDKCGNIVCANKPKDMCTADYTDFKCEYDSVENVCKEKKYTCNDLGEQYCQFSKILGMNCIWSIHNKCEDFDCTIAKNCPFKYCAYSNKQCLNPTTKTDCTALTYSQCQLSSDGYGNFCLVNQYNVCKSYEAQIECSQWNDQPLLICLTLGCYIENFKCRDAKCSDFYTKQSCNYIYEDDTNSITVCKWTGRYCVEATSQDIESFTKEDCVLNSVLTYEWENGKCQKCVNPVSSNTNSQNNNQSSSSSTQSNSSSTSSSSTTGSSTTNSSTSSTTNSSTSSSSTSSSSTTSSTSNSSTTSSTSNSSTTSSSTTSSSTTNSSTTNSSNSSTSNTQPTTNENSNSTPTTNDQTSNNQQNSQSSTNETPTESSENNNQTPITNETEPNSNQETSNQIDQENSNQNNTLNTNSTISDNQNTTQTNNTNSSQNQTVSTVINQVQNNDTSQNQTFTNLTSKIKAQIKANDMLEIQVQMFEHVLWITIAFIYLS